mmetsp:Transcript_33972/g.107989  ORF Transcript_33972/g.107989 Transcript_33972/m.107989 type:complete len:209 (-) Transcript_33972:488-1114(-)
MPMPSASATSQEMVGVRRCWPMMRGTRPSQKRPREYSVKARMDAACARELKACSLPSLASRGLVSWPPTMMAPPKADDQSERCSKLHLECTIWMMLIWSCRSLPSTAICSASTVERAATLRLRVKSRRKPNGLGEPFCCTADSRRVSFKVNHSTRNCTDVRPTAKTMADRAPPPARATAEESKGARIMPTPMALLHRATAGTRPGPPA